MQSLSQNKNNLLPRIISLRRRGEVEELRGLLEELHVITNLEEKIKSGDFIDAGLGTVNV